MKKSLIIIFIFVFGLIILYWVNILFINKQVKKPTTSVISQETLNVSPSIEPTLKYQANGFPINKVYYPPKKKANSAQPATKGKSAAVLDVKSGEFLYNFNSDQVLPIASITKLMSMLVFLDANPNWDKIYQMSAEDRVEGGRINLFTGEKLKVNDLFYTALVGSDNVAVKALVHSTGKSEEDFVKLMNQKAQKLGLKNTSFSDATGLDNNSVSTAEDIAKLARIAFSNKYINDAVLTKEYVFSTLDNKKKEIISTDDLLVNFPQNGLKILGGKTGFTDRAGYCFVGKFADKNGNEIIALVLGSESDKTRFKETKNLAEWTYDNYLW